MRRAISKKQFYAKYFHTQTFRFKMISKIIMIFIYAPFTNQLVAQSITKWDDSLALSVIRETEGPNYTGVNDKIVNGKKIVSKNYYSYKSFTLKLSDSSSIYVINFGTYTSDNPIFMMIVEEKNGLKEPNTFGKKSYSEEIKMLSTLFDEMKDSVQEEYQIEITDLFVRCRRGQRKTPIYVH